MTHKIRRKQLQNVKKKVKNVAGAVAVAAILSTALLPVMPTTIAHASASPGSSTMPNSISQQVEKTKDSSTQLNYNASVVIPTEKNNLAKQANPNIQPDPNVRKTPVKTSKLAKQANPNVQPDPNAQKTPVKTSKLAKQANPNIQPDPNASKAPVKTSTLAKQANPNVQPDPNVDKSPVKTGTKTSADNAPTSYKQVLDIKATAYAPGPHDNDQWGNKTYIGSQVRPGIIAVDPSVIPLGSRVYIEYPDGHGEYAVAEDTGGAIKGNRVDIAKWTVSEAQDFGIKNVKVYVVSTPEKV